MFERGKTYPISWSNKNSVKGSANQVRILLIKNSDGSFTTLATVNSPDNQIQTYNWIIPTNINPDQYRIHIEYTDITECPGPMTCYNDRSDASFNIVSGSLTTNKIVSTYVNVADTKATSATLVENVNVFDPNSILFFIYGTNPNLTNYSCGAGSGCIQTQGIAVNESGIFASYSMPVNNLLPQTRYYFRAYINNNIGGVVEGSVSTFITEQ